MTKEFTCIRCPIGCSLIVTQKNDKIIVSGYTCKRGEEYAINEFTNPLRTVTTLVTLADGRIMPVKTSKPIAKNLIFAVLAECAKLRPLPLEIGGVVSENIASSGSNLVVTGEPTGFSK